jgi:hypothetical protein
MKCAKDCGIAEPVAEPCQGLGALSSKRAAEGFRSVSEAGQPDLPICGGIGRCQPANFWARGVHDTISPSNRPSVVNVPSYHGVMAILCQCPDAGVWMRVDDVKFDVDIIAYMNYIRNIIRRSCGPRPRGLGPGAKFRCRFPAAAFFPLFGVGKFRCRAFHGAFISSTLSD